MANQPPTGEGTVAAVAAIATLAATLFSGKNKLFTTYYNSTRTAGNFRGVQFSRIVVPELLRPQHLVDSASYRMRARARTPSFRVRV